MNYFLISFIIIIITKSLNFREEMKGKYLLGRETALFIYKSRLT